MINIDFSSCQNMTAAQKHAREVLGAKFKEFLVKECGEENVSQVGKHEYAFVCGMIDDEGYPVEVCATVKPVIKNWKDKIGDKRQIEAYDRLVEASLYEMEKEDAKDVDH